jgi:thioredoxin-dependent peroxiredoxin
MNRSSRLSKGEFAPPLEGVSGLGQAVSLAAHRGSRVWVAFFRYTSCSFCSLRIHKMVSRADEWLARGLRIIGVFQSPPAAVGEFMRDRAVKFQIIGDPEEALYQQWGLQSSFTALLGTHLIAPMLSDVVSGRVFNKHGTVTRIPADFLIDEQGRIAHAFYGRDIGDHIPFAEVDRFLDIPRDG